jgi:hypothetical protein
MEKINESEDIIENTSPIQYLLIGDISNSKIITEFSSTINSTQIKKEINQIFAKICKTQSKKYGERSQISSKDSIYYYTLVKPSLLFIILVEDDYSEELVFELIDKINEEKITTLINEETQELNPNGRVELKNIIDIYQKKGDEENENENKENEKEKEKLKDKDKVEEKKDIMIDDDSSIKIKNKKITPNFDNKIDIKTEADSQNKTTEEIEDIQTKNDVFLLTGNKRRWDIRNMQFWRDYRIWIYMAVILLIILIIVIII